MSMVPAGPALEVLVVDDHPLTPKGEDKGA
jgi:hypothetical protein